MKYIKYGLIALMITVGFAAIMTSASNSTHYSFLTINFPKAKSTHVETNMTKTSYNFQKLENYSTSTATINNAELKTISVVDYVFNQFVGNTFSTSSIGPGVTKTISEIPTVVTTQIFGAVPGVYQLTLTKNKTSGARTFGGVWWLDEEYYNQTH